MEQDLRKRSGAFGVVQAAIDAVHFKSALFISLKR